MPKKEVSCPVEITLDVIFGRWKVLIIHQLLEDTKRFNQLQHEQFQHFIPNFGMIRVLAESTLNSELQTDCDFCFQLQIPNTLYLWHQ